MRFFFFKYMRIFIIISKKINRIISIVEFVFFRFHILWGTDQYMFISQWEKVRTFPHRSDFSGTVCRKNGLKFPFF